MRFDDAHREKLSTAQRFGIIDKIIGNKKLCPRCSVEKELSNFNLSSKRKNGYQLWCKNCGLNAKKTAYHLYRKESVKKLARDSQLRSRGLDKKSYAEMVKKQKGLCLICKTVPTKGGNQFMSGYLVVDHCHKTGITRGLLCPECNLGLGKFNDDIKIMKNAIKYIRRFNTKEKK